MIRSHENSDKVANFVESNPAIMDGTPVFRGTRIPVHVVADMIEQGTPTVEILEGYPSLTREMVEYAGIFAATIRALTDRRYSRGPKQSRLDARRASCGLSGKIRTAALTKEA